MSAPWQWQAPDAAPSSGSGWGRVALVVVGLVVLAVAVVGGLVGFAASGGGLGTAEPRALPGDHQAGPLTFTAVEVREDYADDFQVQASARYDGLEPFDADLEVDILNDEQIIGSGSVSVHFAGAGTQDATFFSYDDYEADFDEVIFRTADPLTQGLANVMPVEGTFRSGDFSLSAVRVGEDTVGDFEVRGTVTYGGADPIEADLTVVIDGPAGNLGQASASRSFEPGLSQPVEFITTADHTDDAVVLTLVATPLGEPSGRDVPPPQAPALVPLPGDRVVDG